MAMFRAWLALIATMGLTAPASAVERRCDPSDDPRCDPRARLASLQLTFHAPAAEPPTKPREIAPQEPRHLARSLRGPRALREVEERRLLLREIAQTDRLLAATPHDSPDRPRLMRRVAESYVELARALEAEGPGADDRAARARRARRRAIGHYRAIVDQHPSYCTTPRDPVVSERGCVDESLYFLAHELALDGDAPGARAVYQRLVDAHPRSKHAPAALLALGELLTGEARRGGSWEAAAEAYERVLAVTAASHPLRGYAHYRLGHVRWSAGDHARALDGFKRAVDHARQHPEAPHAGELLAAALRDLVPVYAQAGDPTRAHAFFSRLGASPHETRVRLEDLGVAAMDSGRFDAAISLYRDLLGRFDDARACRYQGAVVKATLATRAADKAAIGRALDALVAHHDAHRGRGDDDARVCANLTAALVTETAMAWHAEAVGTGGHPGSGDGRTLDAAARLYEIAARSFDEATWATFRFPHVARHDWPTLARVLRAHGLLLLHREDWEGAGEAFARAYHVDPQGPEAAEALHVAALCWQQAYLAHRTAPNPNALRAGLGRDGREEAAR